MRLKKLLFSRLKANVVVYDLEVCPLTKSDLKSLDEPLFMKLFNTSNIQMVNECQVYFGFDLPSDRQTKKFMSVYCFLVKTV